MSPDLTNGLFELGGSIALLANIVRLYRDKRAHGVTWYSMLFFFMWAAWNLYYYPTLEQWWSFAGGVCMLASLTVWIGQMLYYRRRS
jgi:uncharacterized membrane protein YfcA